MSALAHMSVNLCTVEKKVDANLKTESKLERKKKDSVHFEWANSTTGMCLLFVYLMQQGTVLLTAIKLISNPGYLMYDSMKYKNSQKTEK